MTPDTGVGTVDLLELLEKEKSYLPVIIKDFARGRIEIDDRRSKLVSELKDSVGTILSTSDPTEESLYTIKAIFIFQEMHMLDDQARKIFVGDIFSRVPESVASGIEKKWPSMYEELKSLIKSS